MNVISEERLKALEESIGALWISQLPLQSAATLADLVENQRTLNRQAAPEFGVKIVDERASAFDKREFSKEQEAWIAQVSVVHTELAKQQLRVAIAAQNAGNAASIAEQESEAFATMTKNSNLLWERAPL